MRHNVFLSWLVYFVAIILLALGLLYLDIPQIALISDHSHQTLVLLGMYGLSEIFSARQAWKISNEHKIATELSKWLHENALYTIDVTENSAILHNYVTDQRHTVPSSEVGRHISGLHDMAANGNQVDQSILLSVLADRLDKQISIIEFIAGRVVWVGILATILGVILAFWPLLGAAGSIDVIRLKLGGFFSGIAVAFIPTAASFVFKIALDLGTKILTSGMTDVVTIVARISETKLLPYFENKAK